MIEFRFSFIYQPSARELLNSDFPLIHWPSARKWSNVGSLLDRDPLHGNGHRVSIFRLGTLSSGLVMSIINLVCFFTCFSI